MAHLLAAAGMAVWSLTIIVLVQRQRVLHRRLVRLERLAGVRSVLARPPAPRPPRLGRTNVVPPTSDRVPTPPPPAWPTTAKQLAALARPLQRAGG